MLLAPAPAGRELGAFANPTARYPSSPIIMADIRLVRPRGHYVWLVTGLLAALALGVWAWGTFMRDPTKDAETLKVGAAANFGVDRAPVLPARPVPFDSMMPLQTRDLGRFVQLRGLAASPVRNGGVWVRADDGRRILVRFEPLPPEDALRRVQANGRVDLTGYLDRIALAEFRVWMDSLGVSIPKPPPGRKFGDLPDPEFARVDKLFIKDYYISVRPEALRRNETEGADES